MRGGGTRPQGSRVHRTDGPKATSHEDRFAKPRRKLASQRPEGPTGLSSAADGARRELMGMWVAGRVGPRGPSISRLANPSFYRITGTTKWRTLRSGQDCKFAFSSLSDVREAVSTAHRPQAGAPSAPGRMVLRPGILLVREVHGTKRQTVTHCLFQGHLGAPSGRGKKQHDHYCGHLLTSAPCTCVPDTRLHTLGSEPHDHTGRLQRPHLRGEGTEAQRGGVACPRAKGRGDLTQTPIVGV